MHHRNLMGRRMRNTFRQSHVKMGRKKVENRPMTGMVVFAGYDLIHNNARFDPEN